MIGYIRKYLSNVASELGKSMEDMDMKSVERTTHIIVKSKKQGGQTHVTGIGKPGHVTNYITPLLSSTRASTYELHGTEAAHESSGQVKKENVVIAISNSGEAMELGVTAQTLIADGVHIISCTGNPQSVPAKQSEMCLVAYVDEGGDALGRPSYVSILLETFILQCLSVVSQEAKKLDLNRYVR